MKFVLFKLVKRKTIIIVHNIEKFFIKRLIRNILKIDLRLRT